MPPANRHRKHERSVSLRTMSMLAIICFIAGAMLPSRILHLAVPASQAATPAGDGNERAFMTENDVAMNRMMADMTVKPTGDVNRDFVAMMIPHHQGAIDMAKAELAGGKDPELLRLARNIVAAQQREIRQMRDWQAKHPAKP